MCGLERSNQAQYFSIRLYYLLLFFLLFYMQPLLSDLMIPARKTSVNSQRPVVSIPGLTSNESAAPGMTELACFRVHALTAISAAIAICHHTEQQNAGHQADHDPI